MNKKITYIYDEELVSECNRLPTMLNRGSIVQDLIESYYILHSENVLVVKSIKATDDYLQEFHSNAYINFLKKTNNSDDLEPYEEEQIKYGLGYDCPLLERNYDLMCRIAGGTLTAVLLLCKKISHIAINWFGGWHHAQRDGADGFCYVNDIVLGIQKLHKVFGKILYIDLDVHHGNGVQNAFELNKDILTLSFHKKEPGFYPGTGSINDIGSSTGLYYSLNVPFLEGISDQTYLRLFENIFERVYSSFLPAAIVVQCGGDILNGDPIGQCNVTINGMSKCIKKILNCNIPCLLLGGGGYNFPNTARYWTYLTSVIVGKQLNEDVPDFCEYFTLYSPSYELTIQSGNQKDRNTDLYINSVISTIHKYCQIIAENVKNS